MDRTHHFYERRKNDLWHISNTLLCRPPPLFFFFWFSDLRHSEYCVLNDNGKSREHTANSGVHSRLTIRITAHMPPVRQIEFICLQMCAEEHAIVRLHCCGMSNRNVKRIDQSCLILLMRRRVHCFFLHPPPPLSLAPLSSQLFIFSILRLGAMEWAAKIENMPPNPPSASTSRYERLDSLQVAESCSQFQITKFSKKNWFRSVAPRVKSESVFVSVDVEPLNRFCSQPKTI